MRTVCSADFGRFEFQDRDFVAGRCGPVSGTEAAFRRLVDEYARKVQTVLFAIFGDRQAAEAISLNVFARVHREVPSSANPWLDLIRISIAECRQARWKQFFIGSSAIKKNPPGVEEWNCSDASKTATVVRLLSALPWKQRMLLVLREVAKLSPEQMAIVLNSTPVKIRVDLFNARRSLLKKARA